MPTTVTLRPAEAGDAARLLPLLEAEGLEAAFPHQEFHVAEADGRVIAGARLKPLPGGAHELASVVVDPAWRGHRVGERLVRQVLEGATGPVWALALAPGFFSRLGFRRAGEVPAALRAKSTGACASRDMVPMLWTPPGMAHTREVQSRYAAIAAGACAVESGGCCAPTGSGSPYTPEELARLPPGAHLNLGTGNPVRAADLRPGETVVDLGSGGGVDVLLAAHAVGPEGRAIGVDVTPEMVVLARRNADAAELSNASFLEAPIERVPLPDGVADVIVSNCVINLAEDPAAVLREARRLLKPGGRFIVSDVLRADDAPPAQGSGCESRALTEATWRELLGAAGFRDVTVTRTTRKGYAGTALVSAWR